MYKSLTIILFLFSFSAFSQTSFSNGYKQGYKEGFCYNDFGCIEPISPLPPIPRIGENSNSYKDGYQRGFIDGQNSKTSKGSSYGYSTPSNSNQYYNQYTPRQYGDYIEPYDFNLMYQVLEAKQKQYNNRIREYERQAELQKFYSETLSSAIKESRKYYEQVYKFLGFYAGLISDYQIMLEYLKSHNPNLIIGKYPNNLTFEQVKSLVSKLESNTKQIEKEYATQAWNIFTWFTDRPNKLIGGSFKTNSVTDFRYNSSNGLYEPQKKLTNDTYFFIASNIISFLRTDKPGVLSNIIGLSRTESEYYIFEDGLGGIMVISKDLKTITFFYDKDLSNNRYRQKTVYENISSIPQNEFIEKVKQREGK